MGWGSASGISGNGSGLKEVKESEVPTQCKDKCAQSAALLVTITSWLWNSHEKGPLLSHSAISDQTTVFKAGGVAGFPFLRRAKTLSQHDSWVVSQVFPQGVS